MDIVLKCIQAVLMYKVLRHGVPKSNGTFEKRIHVVVTSGLRDNIVVLIVVGTPSFMIDLVIRRFVSSTVLVHYENDVHQSDVPILPVWSY